MELSKIIAEQIRHNGALTAEQCYDEIVNFLKQDYSDYTFGKVLNADKIIRLANFQYLFNLKTKQVQIINKYFNN